MKLYPNVPDNLAEWAAKQPVFFTASAGTHTPRVNVSPKGLTASHLAFLDANTVAYVDRSGSGCETIAHAYDNGRLTLMFISFGPAPRILRLFCRAQIVERGEPSFESWVARVLGGRRDGGGMQDARAVIVGHVWQTQTSCGFGVPLVKREMYDSAVAAANELSVFEERTTLDDSWRKKADKGQIGEYQAQNNAASIDGLPGLKMARRAAGRSIWLTNLRARLHRALAEKDGVLLGALLATFLYGLVFLSLTYGVFR